MQLRVQRKTIDTSEIAKIIQQGEKNADILEIILDKTYNGIDLSQLTYTMQGVSEKGTEARQTLPKRIEGETVVLTWTVSGDFTAVAGKLYLTLTGVSDDGNTVIKFDGQPISVNKARTGEYDIPADVVTQALQQVDIKIGQMQSMVVQVSADKQTVINQTALSGKNLTESDKIKAQILALKTEIEKLQAEVYSDSVMADQAADRAETARDEAVEITGFNPEKYYRLDQPSTVLTGQVIHNKESRKGQVASLVVEGETQQTVTEQNKNLWLLKDKTVTQYGVTTVVNAADGTITINGTVSGGNLNVMFLVRPFAWKNNQKYSVTAEVISGTLTGKGAFYLFEACTNQEGTSLNPRLNIGPTMMNGTTKLTGSAITASDISTKTSWVKQIVWAEAGSVFNNYKIRIQAEEGNATEWTAPIPDSPTPEFSAEYHGAGESGKIEVKVTGKNLCSPVWEEHVLNNCSDNGIAVITKLANGTYQVTNKTNNTFIGGVYNPTYAGTLAATWTRTLYLPVSGLDYVYLNRTITGLKDGNSNELLCFTDKNYILVSIPDSEYTKYIKTKDGAYTDKIPVPPDAAYIGIRFGIASNTLNQTVTFSDYSITTEPVTEWEPYQSQTIEIPTTVGENKEIAPLHRIGNIADYVDLTKGEIVRRIKEYVFTPDNLRIGGPYNEAPSSPVVQFNFSLPNVTKSDRSDKAISTLLPTTKLGDNSRSEGFYPIDKLLTVLINKSRLIGWSESLTAEQKRTLMKNWLTTQYNNGTPLKVLYELETPEITKIRPEAIDTYQGATNISASEGNLIGVFDPAFENDTARIAREEASACKDKAPLTNNAGSHNAIYRGKSLGTSVTSAQYAAISAGTFEDLYIGDYWTIGGVNYRIAAFDYYLRCGDTDCTTHHAVIVPDTKLYDHVMNDTNITTGGYVGSKMYTEGLTQAKNTIKAAFNGHVLKHRIYLVNAVTDGRPSASAWCDSEVELMNEQMVYGGSILMPAPNGTTIPTNYRVDKSQLPLFTHRPDLISNRLTSWLRDVVTASAFANVGGSGVANYGNASNSHGVRPAFCIS